MTDGTTRPQRIQRKRVKGWQMPPGAVYVGRGTVYGNPFRIYRHCIGVGGDWGVEDTGRFCAPCGHGWTRAGAAKASVGMYRTVFDEEFPPNSTARYIVVEDLRGRDLACFCPLDAPCHADVLLDLANRAEGA